MEVEHFQHVMDVQMKTQTTTMKTLLMMMELVNMMLNMGVQM